MEEIDKYILTFPVDIQNILKKIKKIILKISPNSSPSMSYGVPTFKLNNQLIIHFAAFKKHIGIFPGPKTVEVFKDKLLEKQISTGTIRFYLDKEIPYSLIEEIIKYNKNNIS